MLVKVNKNNLLAQYRLLNETTFNSLIIFDSGYDQSESITQKIITFSETIAESTRFMSDTSMVADDCV